jgi:hypothetical protein
MAYIILIKNIVDNKAYLHSLAKDQNDLNCLSITSSNYTIVEESEENFNAVKNGTKYPVTYDNSVISYENVTPYFHNKEALQNYIEEFKNKIKIFTDNDINKTKPSLETWNNYYNQLNDLSVELSNPEFNALQFPLEKSLEQYFDDLGKTSLNPLQLP